MIVNDNKSPKTAQENPASDSYPLGKKEEEKVREEEARFYKLNEIDGKREEYAKRRYDESVTLKSFCESFRNYAASRLKLYYSLSDIRKFVAGLGVTHLLILQGISGTGKTSLAYALGEFLGNKSTVIPVQPMWKERTDMIGYYNEFTGRFNETTLLEKMYEANYSKDIYITVLDEMPENVSVDALLATSASAYSKTDAYNAESIAQADGDPTGTFNVAAAAQNSETGGKVVWLSTSGLLDETMDQMVSGSNSDLVLNAFSWLTGSESGITIHAKSLTTETLTVPSGAGSLWSGLLMFAIPGAMLVLGVVIWAMRRKRGWKTEKQPYCWALRRSPRRLGWAMGC